MKCTVCGKEINEKKPICPSCGFDYSCCVELHPTFVKEIGVQKTLSQRKKEERQKQGAEVIGKQTGSRVDASTRSSQKEDRNSTLKSIRGRFSD